MLNWVPSSVGLPYSAKVLGYPFCLTILIDSVLSKSQANCLTLLYNVLFISESCSTSLDVLDQGIHKVLNV